ncbi:ATP-binding protein [Amycolatopsis keratiniphila]|uniref:sensor histidine kinase n=1 Tax=Amycolatopsis keratiniphila TaxID=129921 RepID=UPI0034085F38
MPGTHRYNVERGLQRSFAVLTVLLIASLLGVLLPIAGQLHLAPLIASAGFLCYLLLLTLRSWRLQLSAGDGTVASVAALGTILANLVPAQVLLPLSARPTPVVVAVILVAGFHDKRRAWLICTGLTVAHLLVTARIDGMGNAVEGLWPILAAPVASAAVTTVLRAAGTRADQAQQRLHEAQVSEAKAAGLRAAHRDFQRVLHDDVASALRAVATAGIDEQTIRASCADAVRKAEQEPQLASHDHRLDVQLATMAAPSGVDLTLAIDGPVVVPATVARATLDAVRQALDNVGRHAQATGVTVRLRGENDRFVVEICDDGVGFRPAEVRGTSVGLRDSVIGRMAEAGGDASIESEPGMGTTVTLSWSAPRPDRQSHPTTGSWVEDLHAAVDDLRWPMAAVCFPYLLSMCIPAVRHLDAAPAMPWLAGWYSVMAAVTTVLIFLARRPIPRVWVRLAAVWTGGGAVWALLVIPADSITTFASWPIGAIGPFLVVAFTVGGRLEATLVLFAQQIVLALLVFSGHFHTTSYLEALPAALSSSLCLGSGAVITTTIARLGKVVRRSGAERTAIASLAAAHDSRLAMRSRRITEIGREVLPFLRTIATGGLLDADPDRTRARARTLEWFTRDELHIPGVLDAHCRKRLETARLHGCTVTIQADTDTMEPPAVVRDLINAALSAPVAPHELILSLHPGHDETTISLVCLPGNSDRANLLRSAVPATATVHDEPDATCVDVLISTSSRLVRDFADSEVRPCSATMESTGQQARD